MGLTTVKFGYKREFKQNPYVGFTEFQHFGNGKLYSDIVVKPENNLTETERIECYPIPAKTEENGREQGYYPYCSVAYIRVLWKEFEPCRGKFNYAFIEDILKRARENGQTVMLRIMPHSTRESDDVPDWLKKLIVCPPRPQGKREKASPSDPRFLELFGKAIKALGKRFDGNPVLDEFDVSLPGAWGEGCSAELFSDKKLKKFMDVYINAFRKTKLIGQLTRPDLVHYIKNKNRVVGWRADCIGKPVLTYEMVPRFADKMNNIWETGPVSFEAYWWFKEWQRQGWDIDEIIRTTLCYHISTFNAKSLPIPFEWKEKIDEWIAKMGYHFVIEKACFSDEIKRGEIFNLSLKINNVGVAPIYNFLPLYVKFKNSEREITIKTAADIRKWKIGVYEENIRIKTPKTLLKGRYALEIGIGGKNEPSVAFATDAERDGDYFVLSEINVI